MREGKGGGGDVCRSVSHSRVGARAHTGRVASHSAEPARYTHKYAIVSRVVWIAQSDTSSNTCGGAAPCVR